MAKGLVLNHRLKMLHIFENFVRLAIVLGSPGSFSLLLVDGGATVGH